MNQNDVKIFMEAGEQYTQREPSLFTSEENTKAVELYLKLIAEEYKELLEGIDEKNVVKVADGCGDLIWVILGLCNSAGINMNAVWYEITRSNMSKLVDGKLVKREDGKILKPDTYVPPNIAKALGLGE